MSKPGRIAALDGMRGLLLVDMTVTHLSVWPLVKLGTLAVAYQTFGFFSSAEGFFFLSGLIAAIAYGKLADRSGMPALRAAVGRRMAKIYLVNLAIAAVLVLTPLAAARHPGWLSFLIDEQQRLGPSIVFEQLAFVNLPWLCDILPVYVMTMPLIYVLMRFERQRRRYAGIILVTGLWMIGQLTPYAHLTRQLEAWFPGHRFSLGWFEACSWQLLFGSAFLIGRAAQRDTLPAWLKRPPLALTLACLSVALFFVVQERAGLPLPAAFAHRWTAVQPLAPLRLLDVVCFGIVIRKVWPWIARPLAWRPLRTIGEASLYIFAYHVVVVYIVASFVSPAWTKLQLAAVLLASLLSLYPVAVLSLKFRAWRKRSGDTRLNPIRSGSGSVGCPQISEAAP